MIPSAHVIGSGFLISKDGVDKTRRKSLITRLCNKPIKYGFLYKLSHVLNLDKMFI